MDCETSFGHWLTRRRKALRLSRVELAQRVGCATVTLRKIEADERRPSQQIAAKLADHLNVAAQERLTFINVARGELGVHRLSLPDQIADRPAIATRAALRTHLPVPPTPLVGRLQEVAAIRDHLMRADVRLLTLSGAPGIGKTRLSLQVAAELQNSFADGVIFIPLAPIRDPKLVIATIGRALGVGETASRSVLEGLHAYLRERHLLLVLDNFEQVLEAASLIVTLLAAAPRLKMLITSRAVLHLSGEHAFPVPPLRLPDRKQLLTVEQLSQYDAVALFIARARAARPEFQVTNDNAPAVAEICHRLDGLPLVIELAAARSAVLAPQALLARLDQRLKLLTGGARDLPIRQQTLRSTIDWSYELLSTAEQTLFWRLAVFVGGCTLDAVEAVCTAAGDLALEVLDGLTALVEKSLLRQEEMENDAPRFVMLETVREYALERLEAGGEIETVRRCHAAYYLALAEATGPALFGPQQRMWMERLEGEHDNLHAALVWSQEVADGAEPGLRLAAVLSWFWMSRGHLREGQAWLAKVLAHPAATAPTLARAKALRSAGHMAEVLGDLTTSEALYTESLGLSRALADQRDSATTLANMGISAWIQGDYLRATALCEESLALCRELGDRHGSAWALNWLGSAMRDMGDYVQSMAHFAASLALYDELGDIGGSAQVLMSMGIATFNQGETTRARLLCEEALALSREAGQSDLTAFTLSNLGRVVQVQGDAAQALALLEESVAWFRQTNHNGLERALYHGGVVASVQGDDVRAIELLREALVLQQRFGLKMRVMRSLGRLAGLAARQQQPVRAARLFGAAEALREAVGAPLPPAERADYERDVAAARSQLDEAAFATAWAAGQALTLEQAVAYALEGSESDADRTYGVAPAT